MKLVLSSKSNRKWPKNNKTKAVHKSTYMWVLGLKVIGQMKNLQAVPIKPPSVIFFSYFPLSNATGCLEKLFSK